MIQKLVRVTEKDADDYVRIGARTTTAFNAVTTDLEDAKKEIRESVTYMIEVDGRRVGFLSYVWKASNYAYIAEVQIDPDFQGRGHGGFALGMVLRGDLKAVEIVDLYTHPENPAQRLYLRHGFRPTGEIIANYQGMGPRIRMLLQR